MTEPYEVYAIRYAHHDRKRSENFMGGDPHDGPMPLDYFVWAIIGNGRKIVVDTGFDEAMARKRQRHLITPPERSLAAIGIEHQAVRDVILTHLHHDHAGNHHLFPDATFHLQDREAAYVTGRAMCHHALRHPYEEEDIVRLVRRVFAGRVRFHDGVSQVAPGITVHHMGGHTQGIQAVRVLTRRGYMVLASDVTHFYANIEEERPFPVLQDVLAGVEAYRKLRELADGNDLIVPGHDPLVMQRFPRARPGLADVVRLDAARTGR